MIIYAPVSMGEIVDKLTVLEIKRNLIDVPEKLISINEEYSLLREIAHPFLDAHPECWESLLDINKNLWEAVDCQKLAEQDIDDSNRTRFLEASRNAYILNKRRFFIKKKINELSKSSIQEHKDYD